ncbi:MAG: hypothetical protein J2P37_08925 [Ktedonobacteraceae bacterium]|nr:hypothetical protein [Ktedonobacteraceae bacterium]MBO0792262.1 hypothetical protein [Ktedonobacteraceae bacterium]
MKKICIRCGEERDAEEDFRWEYKTRGIRMARCKYCQSELSKHHYQKNKHIYNERTRIRKAQTISENTHRIADYLSRHPCVDCGQTDPRLLEFDHINGKKYRGIARLISWGFNWQIIEAEIAKCEIRCANCHRIKTIEKSRGGRSTQPLRKPRKKTWQLLYAYLSTHPCVDCGYTDIRVLEFDHVHGDKTDEISHMLSQGCGWARISSEIAKCEVRCANCHRIKTNERGSWWKHIQSEPPEKD